MTIDRRILIASVAAFAAAPALAAETPDAFVKRLYAPDSSPDMPIYAPALRAEIARDAERDMNRLDFDWLSGGQDLPKIRKLKVVTLNTSGPDRATVQATFTNYGEARVRRFELVRIKGQWRVADVYMSPENTRLMTILTTPNDGEE